MQPQNESYLQDRARHSLGDANCEGDDSKYEKNTGTTKNTRKDEDLVGFVFTTSNIFKKGGLEEHRVKPTWS